MTQCGDPALFLNNIGEKENPWIFTDGVPWNFPQFLVLTGIKYGRKNIDFFFLLLLKVFCKVPLGWSKLSTLGKAHKIICLIEVKHKTQYNIKTFQRVVTPVTGGAESAVPPYRWRIWIGFCPATHRPLVESFIFPLVGHKEKDSNRTGNNCCES